MLQLLALATLLPALQAPQVLVVEGTPAFGVTVDDVGPVTVNDRGDWVATVFFQDAALGAVNGLVRNGTFVVRAGDALDPPGAAFSAPTYLHLDNAGRLAGIYLLEGVPPLPDRAVYVENDLWLAQGQTTGLSAFAPGSTYTALLAVDQDDHQRLLLAARITEPGGDPQDVLVRLTRSGGVLQEELLVREGQTLPGGPAPLGGLDLGPTFSATSDVGEPLFLANFPGSGTVLYLGDVPLLAEGTPAPGGGTWLAFQGELATNDNREWALAALVDDGGTTETLVVNGAVFRRVGDSLPAIAPETLAWFGAGPIFLSNSRELLWWGAWSTPAGPSDSALFVGDEPLVREETTLVGGQRLTLIRWEQQTYAMSRNGRWVVFRGELEDGVERLFRVDRGQRAFAEMRNGSGLNPLCTRMLTPPVVGTPMLVGVETFAVPGTTASFVAGVGAPRSGPALPSGELLIDFASGYWFLSALPAPGTVHPIVVPNDPAVIGVTAYMQGVLSGPAGLTLCNALDATAGL